MTKRPNKWLDEIPAVPLESAGDRLTELTDDQRAGMSPYAQEVIRAGA